ncbi:unnamed protein product, partial [Amoebophrya sp. A120]
LEVNGQTLDFRAGFFLRFQRDLFSVREGIAVPHHGGLQGKDQGELSQTPVEASPSELEARMWIADQAEPGAKSASWGIFNLDGGGWPSWCTTW